MTMQLPADISHLPPPGLNYIAVIRTSLGIMVAALAGTAILVPLLVTLFFFSTKQLRKKPIFILNVVSIILGLVLGISITFIMYQGIINPSNLLTPAQHALPFCLLAFTPVFVEGILLFRLLVTARIVNIAVYVYRYLSCAEIHTNPVLSIQAGWFSQIAFIEAGCFLQIIDNTIISSLFLYKLNIRKFLTKPPATNENCDRSYTSTIRVLFWIAVSNFVFPVLLAIAQLIFIFHDICYIHGMHAVTFNCYVSIIGVLLATVWAATTRWSENHNTAQPPARNPPSTFRFTVRDNNTLATMSVSNHPVDPSMENSRHSSLRVVDSNQRHDDEPRALDTHKESKVASLV
ncbi:hypothetical protein AMATHDRAFT_43024 [Amanita thiersii Skay4041]|uniref:G-protein coupled receptors family 1 profile domain-containing protein n=1 Tax=Amanita thiersii Skay4041 TaxID=703135 RepID=A0A2A9NB51_9AGAR|nr:hypothetical protein AMATHDRAFT_43024 [Amanita thiersii Skay4041]